MEVKKLFNPEGTRDLSMQRLVGGPSTNLLEFNHCKYSWAEPLYKKMRSFFWIPDEIPLGEDKKQFPTLTPYEQDAYQKTLSFLIFLDSIQIDNLGAIASYITAPEVTACLKAQAFFETIHAQSYDYLLTSVVDQVTRDSVYSMWKDDAHLMRRNRFITDLYEEFIRNPSDVNFIKSSMADFLLEGVYFYSGFAFFYALGRQGKMGGTVSMIRLIQRDENTHLALFTNILNVLRDENPGWFTKEMDDYLLEMVRTAVNHEIAWGQYVTRNQILGLTDSLIDRYIKYLANIRCEAISLPKPYPEITEHPMPWVDSFASMNSTKTDFFERRVTNYQKFGGIINLNKLKPPGD
ncbi:MAG: ribonucleotide-diphosphate reductase subunit beta [Thermoplasmata archaeon]